MRLPPMPPLPWRPVRRHISPAAAQVPGTRSLAPKPMARTHNDHIQAVDSTGRIEVRTSDGRAFRLIRVSDGMELQTLGNLAAVTARANQMTSTGEA